MSRKTNDVDVFSIFVLTYLLTSECENIVFLETTGISDKELVTRNLR